MPNVSLYANMSPWVCICVCVWLVFADLLQRVQPGKTKLRRERVWEDVSTNVRKMEGKEWKMKVSEGEGRRWWDHSLPAPCSNYNILCWVCASCVCHSLHMYKWACAGDFGQRVCSLNYASACFFSPAWNCSLFQCCILVAFLCSRTVWFQCRSTLHLHYDNMSERPISQLEYFKVHTFVVHSLLVDLFFPH